MRWGWRIVLGLVCVIALDQSLRALADWQFDDPDFYANVIARADSRPMTEAETIARGWGWNMQSCEIHRSTFGYPIKTCFGRVGRKNIDGPAPDDFTVLYVWSAKPYIGLKTWDEFFQSIYAHRVLLLTLDKKIIKVF